MNRNKSAANQQQGKEWFHDRKVWIKDRQKTIVSLQLPWQILP
jgi:hypothetical protein